MTESKAKIENHNQNKKSVSNGAKPDGESANGKQVGNENGEKNLSPTAKAALKAFALTYKNARLEKSKRG